MRKPIRASQQSLLPRATWWHTLSLSSILISLSLSLSFPGFYRVFVERSASGDTLKSHEICRATSRSLHTSGREYTRLHPRRQKAYSLVLEAVYYVYLSPTRRERGTRAFRFCEIFRRSLCRASVTAARRSCLFLRSEDRRRAAMGWCDRYVSIIIS